MIELDLEPLSPALGVEVRNFDPAVPLSAPAAAAVRDALLSHQLLLFRGRALTADQQVAFAQTFGRVRDAWQRDNYPCENSKAHYITNMNTSGEIVAARRERSAAFWHSDGSWQRRPARATMLNALHVPGSGGDTHFADMYGVYESLDAETRERLRTLYAVHDVELSRAARDGGWPWRWNWREPSESAQRKPLRFWADVFVKRLRDPANAHPVVLRHPQTGRDCLFVGDHAWRIRGLPLWSGIRRMRAINALPIAERYVYTHRWTPGDLIVWDNLCVLHRADPYDTDAEKRLVRRCVILAGDEDGAGKARVRLRRATACPSASWTASCPTPPSAASICPSPSTRPSRTFSPAAIRRTALSVCFPPTVNMSARSRSPANAAVSAPRARAGA